MARIEIEYQLIPLGFTKSFTRLLCGQGTGRGGVDIAAIKDSLGKPFIPGSTIKGIIREKFTELCLALGKSFCPSLGEQTNRYSESGQQFHFYNNPLIESIFGKTDQLDIKAVFSNLYPDPSEATRRPKVIKRVAIDRRLKRAVPNALFDAEYLITPSLKGKIILWTEENEKLEEDPRLALLLGSIAMLRGVGGHKSTGSGLFKTKLLRAKVGRITERKAESNIWNEEKLKNIVRNINSEAFKEKIENLLQEK